MSAAAKSSSAAPVITPMMQQYMAIKAEHGDALLFYRMGDFYELFFDDAITAAETLNIALTHRGKHHEKPIPMCGVPHHSHENYLHRLIKHGFKVAICEQMEAPEEAKKRGYKAVVKRGVVRIVTPGTLTEDALLDAKQSNYLLALNTAKKQQVSISWLDLSTGDFWVETIGEDDLSAALMRINPTELLIPQSVWEHNALFARLQDWKSALTPHVNSFFDAAKGERSLKQFFEVTSLDSFTALSNSEKGGCGALLEYVALTQKDSAVHLKPPMRFIQSDHMVIDGATVRNLELLRTLSGEYKGSVAHVLNKAVSAAGSRLFGQWLGSPLCNVTAIGERQDAIAFFHEQPDLIDNARAALSQTPDIERALSRLYMQRSGPKDLVVIRSALRAATTIAALLGAHKASLPALLQPTCSVLTQCDVLHTQLDASLRDEVGFHLRDGGFIQDGYDTELDNYRCTAAQSETLREELQARYRTETGINSLKNQKQ